MSRSEDFDSEFWSDPDVAELSGTARYLYIWTWTNPRCNMSGVYRVTRSLIAAETGLADQHLTSAFRELEEHRFAFYDGRVVWVRARVKRLRQKTPNIAKSIATHLGKLPLEHPYVAMFLVEYRDSGWLADTLATVEESEETSGNRRLSATVTDSPRDGDGEKKGDARGKKRSKPSPPSPDEIPADLPENLRPAALTVATTLGRIATAKGAKPVTLAAVGRALAAYPDHDHNQVAGDVEHWWVHGTGSSKPMADVVATYRNRLSSLPVGRVHHYPTAVPAGETAAQRADRENAAIARANGGAA